MSIAVYVSKEVWWRRVTLLRKFQIHICSFGFYKNKRYFHWGYWKACPQMCLELGWISFSYLYTKDEFDAWFCIDKPNQEFHSKTSIQNTDFYKIGEI